MGLQEALNELDGVDPSEAADALQEEHKGLYKEIYSDGFGAGKMEVKGDLEDAKSQMEDLRSTKEDLESRVENLQGEQPETSELRDKYESRIQDLNAKIDNLQDTLNAKDQEHRQALQSERASSFQQQVAGTLKAAGVDEDYADFQAERAVQSDRVQFDDDLNFQLYDSEGLPLSDRNGERPQHEAFAKEVVSEIPDKFISDSRPSNSGLSDTDVRGGKTVARSAFEQMSPREQREVAQDESVTIVD